MLETRKLVIGAVAAVMITTGAAAVAISSEDEGTAIELSQVPQPARDAAQKQLGATIREARVMEQNGQKVYELDGRDSSGQELAVYVSADGKVLRSEKDDD